MPSSRLFRRSLLAAGTLLAASPAPADTLQQALAEAYRTNPTITGQRAAVRAQAEDVPIARAAGLPSFGVSSGYNQNLISNGNSLTSPDRQASASATFSVPLFSGGGVRNSIRAARTRSEGAEIGLRGTESDLFTSVVGAYMDVIRDEAIVGLNRQNVHVLDVNLQASRDRFQVGDLTRTDVAQSQARLELARGQLQQAEAQLISSRENYIRLVGSPPADLQAPPNLPGLPATTDAAVQQALTQNPTLLAAQRSRDATAYDVNVARANRLPQISASVGGNAYNYLGSLGSGTGQRIGQAGQSGTFGLGVNLPIFQGGGVAARIRQAQERRGQSIEAVTEAERGVVAQTRSAYAVWQSSLQVIQSSESAVSANRLSLEGVRAENSVGNRTILDILNAEQELLNSQVTLVTARRDAYVAGFAVLAAMGHAEARDLNLNGVGPLYDPAVYAGSVRHRIWDYGATPSSQPVATRTVDTPAQNATVSRPLDPELEAPVDRDTPNPAGVAPPRN